jgi:hypothetical protein
LREELTLREAAKTVFKIVLAPKKAKVTERFRILHNEKLRHLSGSRGVVELLRLRWECKQKLGEEALTFKQEDAVKGKHSNVSEGKDSKE